jgi:hypothetical protein
VHGNLDGTSTHIYVQEEPQKPDSSWLSTSTASGMVMERYHVDAVQAFALLTCR